MFGIIIIYAFTQYSKRKDMSTFIIEKFMNQRAHMSLVNFFRGSKDGVIIASLDTDGTTNQEEYKLKVHLTNESIERVLETKIGSQSAFCEIKAFRFNNQNSPRTMSDLLSIKDIMLNPDELLGFAKT